MTDDEIRLLLLTLTPEDILKSYVPTLVTELARAVFTKDQREKAVWACAPLVGRSEYWGTPTKWASRRDTLLTEWALKGLWANPAYAHLHAVLGKNFAWTAAEAMKACTHAGYAGTGETFALLTRDPLMNTGSRPKFVSQALLFYREQRRDEAATTLLRDLCRLFYD